MAALIFGFANGRKYGRRTTASVPVQSLLMQINADAVCLVRTQLQHVIHVVPAALRVCC